MTGIASRNEATRSEHHSTGLPILRAGGTAANRGGGEASTSVGGSSAAWFSAKHAPTRTDATHRSRAHRDDSGRGHNRGFPHDEAWFRTIGSGGVTRTADGRRRGVNFQFLFGKTLRSSSQAVVARKNQDCRKICAVAAVVEY